MSRAFILLLLPVLACKGPHEDRWTTPVKTCDDYVGACGLEASCEACVERCGKSCVYRNTDEDTGIGQFRCPEESFVPGQFREGCDSEGR
ncbi:MAG: hypothetical protein H6741_21930 [Alphaproteobacteria bacterium]|nr:hypothetical protein [Alphaproteobacteria bacterium]MCB9795372.1 hypothetical protein [Alphaproteobacteria bacterium]